MMKSRRRSEDLKNKPRPARIMIAFGILLLITAAMGIRMYSMIFGQGDQYTETASAKSTKVLTVYGMRGTIYDANMVPLAYDRRSFDVAFYRDPSKSSDEYRANYTQVIIRTIQIIESMGKSTTTEFWLKKGDDGVWYFHQS